MKEKSQMPPQLQPKTKGPTRKKYVPVWRDPMFNDGDIVISYYIPFSIPEVPGPKGPPPIVIQAETITKSTLPKAMTNAEFTEFRYTEEGQKWFLETVAKAEKILKEREKNRK